MLATDNEATHPAPKTSTERRACASVRSLQMCTLLAAARDFGTVHAYIGTIPVLLPEVHDQRLPEPAS